MVRGSPYSATPGTSSSGTILTRQGGGGEGDRLSEVQVVEGKKFKSRGTGLNFLLQATEGSGFIECGAADRTVGRHPGSRFEPGTGDLEEGTTKEMWCSRLKLMKSGQGKSRIEKGQ